MSLKTTAKELFTSLLAIKASKHLKGSGAVVLVIIGTPEEREVYKSVIAENLGDNVLVNLPGNNYKLGLSLTILGFKGGYSGLQRWIQLLFIRPAPIKSKFIALDYSCSTADDFKFLNEIVNPKIIIVTEKAKLYSLPITNANMIIPEGIKGNSEQMTNIITFGISESANVYFNNYEIDDHGQKFDYSVNGMKGSANLGNFGTHYIYPFLIAKYIKNNV